MIRRNALIRLHEDLLARRERLRKKLAAELAYLQDCNTADASGDSADLAFEADGDDMSSRLAELDDRELSKVQRALAHWNQGTYGICEFCQKPIVLARLNALPYTLFCITCEREVEKHIDGRSLTMKGKWGQVVDAQALMHDERVNLSELERVLSGSGID